MLGSAHNIIQYGVQNKIVPWWCRHHITHCKSWNLLSLDDVCCYWELTSCSIYRWKIACSSNLQPWILKNAPLQNSSVIGQYSHAWRNFTIGIVVGHPHHSPSLTLHPNLNPNGLVHPCQIHKLNHVVLYINNFSPTNITYSSMRIYALAISNIIWDFPHHLLLLSFSTNVHHP